MRHLLVLSLAPALLAVSAPAAASNAFLDSLRPLCGQAFSGEMVSSDAADADMKGQPMGDGVQRAAMAMLAARTAKAEG